MKSKTFFNIIPGEETCCILLYGDIGDSYGTVTSSQITRELMSAEVTYKNIDVRINSIGGEVYSLMREASLYESICPFNVAQRQWWLLWQHKGHERYDFTDGKP